MKIDNIYPKMHEEIIIREIGKNKYILDTVSGTIVKVNDLTINILEECNGVKSVTQIYKNLELDKKGASQEELHELLRRLEEWKVIHLIEFENRKNVLLINPPFPYCHKRYNTEYYTPPLGLLQIAAQLELKGYSAEIIDMAVLDLRPHEIISYVKEREKSLFIIGISCNMSFVANNVIKIADAVKDVYPYVKIILGGNHATFCYEDILTKENSIDYINLYEGEVTFPELCDFIYNERNIKECAGIAYRDDSGRIVKTKERERIEDLDVLEFPAYHLIDMSLYNEAMQGIVMTSRGCPHKCVYCSTAEFNGNVKYYSVSRVIDNVKRLVNQFGLKKITFGDDAFTINKLRTLEICKRITEEKMNISWSCNTRVDMVDEDILRALKAAGCTDILFGIESVSNKVLDTISKRFHFEDVKNSVYLAEKIGIKIKQNYILGLPYETQETLDEMREFIKKTNPQTVEFCILCLFPGTKLYISATKYGIRNFNVPWEKLQLINPGLETDWLTQEQILDNYIENWVEIISVSQN